MLTQAIYIHIPFCSDICSYCDFCKMYYHKNWAIKYLDSLEKETTTKYKGEKIKTIYIGGGTPSSLDYDDLKQLFKILKIINLDNNYEFTFECNIENIDEEKLKILKDYGVNRISYGVQTFNEKFLSFLNRHHHKEEVISIINLTKKYFDNINIDLIYALNNQTIDDLEKDLDQFIKLDVPHISTYSLIIEPHTVLNNKKIDYIDQDLDYEMYKLINKKLQNNGFSHYEVSNYSKKGYESKHNLTYWNNQPYYGFGLGASGYIDNIRYENTRSFTDYCSNNYVKEEHELTLREKMEEEMILGLRKIAGVNKNTFYQKYSVSIEDVFDIDNLIKEGKLKQDKDNIYIPSEYIYLSNEILINFIGE